ncbi:hypothetical protein AB4Y32_31715 [Paraburkholderia phymatum]|uniref:Uncharacterized protein n=1 Tax=Paraburkholderia phymatum TaxID=148447 RepID=A0ACC6U9D0_9BURK
MASVKVSITRAIIGISVLQSVCILVVYWLAPEGTALAPGEGVLATGASLEGDGMLAADALPLAPLAAALCAGVPLMPALLLITPLLSVLLVVLLALCRRPFCKRLCRMQTLLPRARETDHARQASSPRLLCERYGA